MSRKIIETEDVAFSELGSNRTKPEWLEREVSLPFSSLSGDEFEVLCFLMLRAKHPSDRIFYYGKTQDMGRDIVHKTSSGRTRLIQCKNFSKEISPSAIGAEIAKVFVNVWTGKIPEKPDEVIFFVASDLSAMSQDLIQYQAKWIEVAEEYLRKNLKADPSTDLVQFSRTWWPFGDRQTGLAITEDVKDSRPELIETFFGIKKIVDATREEIRQDFRNELSFAVRNFATHKELLDESQKRKPAFTDCNVIYEKFQIASKPLSNWPRTLDNSRWIQRREVDEILTRIETTKSSTCVLLGGPGSGKSALLAHLARKFGEQGVSYLGIKADELDVHVDSLAKLSERLSLPGSITDCIKGCSENGKLVLLVDQLDALADLVDLHSQRLRVLLDLIHSLADMPNVHVVSSCRTFEFRHDARFQTLEVNDIELTLPSWEVISEILNEHGLDGTQWPENFRTILRTPQNLKIFLGHLKGKSEHKVFHSYQGMLEELWYDKVTTSNDSEEKSKLLAIASETMSDREVLWLPLAEFDHQRQAIDLLVADGILHISENRMKFGFQHQTLFSHARARAVAQQNIDLCNYVVKRQHALFVRPTLWSTLEYLREASPETYRSQFYRLCSESVRLHIKHLLLDFLGRLQNPDDFEQVCLENWLMHEDFRKRAIGAITDSSGWFNRLKDNHLIDLMRKPEGTEWELVGLLSIEVNRSKQDVLALLRDHWMRDRRMDEFIFRVLDQLENWCDESVSMVCKIIERTPIRELMVTAIAANVATQSPQLAPRILATQFQKRLRECEAASDPPLKNDANTSFEEAAVAAILYEPKSRFCELVESQDGRYEMPAIAEAAPGEFLKQMWSLFIDALEPLLCKGGNIINTFRHSRSLHYDFEETVGHERPLLVSFRIALRDLGNKDQGAFVEFFRLANSHDSILVQRLLCKALMETEVLYSDLALEFLSSDLRRLSLGDHDDHLRDSIQLIKKIAPTLTEEQIQVLDEKIEAWSDYHLPTQADPPEERFRRRQEDRHRRFRLRFAIPPEQRSDDLNARLNAEIVALGIDVKDGAEKTRQTGLIRAARSPMSPNQMKKADDEHILRLFDDLTDDTRWDGPRYRFGGGVIEASRALAEFAKEEPERAVGLVRKLRNADQQIPAHHVLRSLSESSLPARDFFDLVIELDDLGFDSPEFRSSTGFAIQKWAGKLDGLPEDLCELLKNWLQNWEYAAGANCEEEKVESDEEQKRSVVFDLLGGGVLPYGTYPILSALSYGLMRRDPPAANEWVDILEHHLKKSEATQIWQTLCRELRMLCYVDPRRARQFLENLFEIYPTVRDSRFGVHLIIPLRNILGEEMFTKCCDQIAASDWGMGKQAKGELLGVSYLSDDRFSSVDKYVRQLADPAFTDDEQIRKGIAFAIANLWKYRDYRSRATQLFELMAQQKSREVNRALANVFEIQAFVPNTFSKKIMRITATNPLIIADVSAYHFAETLEMFVSTAPEDALTLANELLNQFESQKEDHYPRNFDLSDSSLTSVALTLQRMDERLKGRGLDLFERLLKLGFAAPSQAVRELDSRPITVVPRRRRLRRRQ